MINKKHKVGVFLGYKVSSTIDEWKENYKKDLVNDALPYGYDRANVEKMTVDYIKLNTIERKIFFNKYFQYAYLYFIKLPVLLFKYDIIWTHYDKDALYIAKLKQFPIINKKMAKQIGNFVWLIDNSKEYNKSKLKSITKLLSRIDMVIYLSSSETQKFIEIFKLNISKLKYVRFGINFEAYSDQKAMSMPKGFSENCKDYILSVGTDIHRDIDLLDKLANEFEDKKFILCSCNQDYLSKQYKSKNLKVINANLSEMRYLYKNCSCVIIPLKYNEHVSGSTTILEAAAMKKAVIVSETPGIRDYVIENKTGILVPIGNLDLMKKALQKLEYNKDYKNQLALNAYNYCSTNFTTDIWAKEHAKLTNEILK
jgi:glycosyltransferase involved in cell wall biosynthesis